MKKLSRNEMASIEGAATCVAACGDSHVMCQGSSCSATDGEGCSGDGSYTPCPNK